MSFFAPLFGYILSLFGFVAVSAAMLELPMPATPAAYSVKTCPELTAQCEFGYMSDNATGCAINECAPDPAIKQREWDAQCVKDQQRSLKDFERYNIKDTERRFKELERAKITVPAEARTGFEQMKAQWQQAQGLPTCQELQDAAKGMNDYSNDINNVLRDAESAMFDVQCAKQAQQEWKDFERYNIKDVETKLRKAAQKKVTVPPVLVDGLPRLKELLAAARSGGATCTEIQDARSELHSLNNDLQEASMQLDFLMQVPQIIKQAAQEIKNTERQWKTALNKAKRSKADLSDLIARGNSLINELKGIFEEFKAVITSGDMDRMRDIKERGESMGQESQNELFEIIRTIDALSNAPRYIKELDRRMKDVRRQAKDMERFQKADTSAFTACLDNVGPFITNAKEEVGRRPADPEALMDAFSAVEEAFSDCDELRRELEGTREEFLGEFIPDAMLKQSTKVPMQTPMPEPPANIVR